MFVYADSPAMLIVQNPGNFYDLHRQNISYVSGMSGAAAASKKIIVTSVVFFFSVAAFIHCHTIDEAA